MPCQSGSEGTVLLIDDEPYLAKSTSRLLRSMGFGVLVASGGEEAVEICRVRGDDIDVVLLDLVLRGMTSVEALRQMRSLHPGMRVILTSGYSKQESLHNFAGMPLDGFLMKPFGYEDLESALRAALLR